jgi:hopanoid biosynthesis associated protein HpnK
MADHKSPKVIFNADDFGLSSSINEAVIKAHRQGVLTSASLMVNGDAFEEAVRLAKETPNLGVGLHLTLVMGRSTLSPDQLRNLVDANGNFTQNPVAAGFSAFFNRVTRNQLETEIAAQIGKFSSTRLKMDHLNGHLNFHLHPAIFDILMKRQREWNIPAMRLTNDIFWLNSRLAKGRWLYRMSHTVIFRLLSKISVSRLKRFGIQYTTNVFGLLQNDLVDEDYLLKLLPALPPAPVEIYSHPNMGSHRHELDALTSPRVKDLIKKLGIRTCRYQDL